MQQQPSAIKLMLCDQLVFEVGTQKPYLLGVFTGVQAESFPTLPQRFDVFAALTDGLGDVTIRLSALRLETDEEIYNQEFTSNFPDPLRVVNMRFRVRQLVYDKPGTYVFALNVTDEEGIEQEIAARRVRVYQA